IKFNLTIPLQQLNGLETLVIIMVANKYAFLQITRRRFSCCRSEERFSRNAETDLVCRLLLEKKKKFVKKSLSKENKNKIENKIISFLFKFFLTSFHTNFTLLFFNDTPTTKIYTLSLHDALPISLNLT